MARDRLPRRVNPKRASVSRIVDAVLRKDQNGKLPSVDYLARAVGAAPVTIRTWLKVDYADLYDDEWATPNEIVEAAAEKISARGKAADMAPRGIGIPSLDLDPPWA